MPDIQSAACHNGQVKTGIPCPHCGNEMDIPKKKISELHGEITGKKGGRRRKSIPCEWCELPFSATEMRLHKPRCNKRPPQDVVGRSLSHGATKQYLKSLKGNENVRVLPGGIIKKAKPTP